MSFSGGTLNVGTLTANFSLNAAGAASSIAGIMTQTNNLKNSFNQTFNIKVDSSSAVANINKATGALDRLKAGFEFATGLKAFDLLEEGVKGLAGAMLGTNAAIEQAQLKFTALSGSAQTAATLMGQLETLAAHSTFGLAEITAAAGGLQAFGVNVANIPPLLNAMQNAAAAAGGDMSGNFNNLARILGELAGGLPLTERQIRQLVTAGIPLQPLAAQLGITVTQLLDVGKTGIVTGDQLVAAFAKVYTSGNLGDFMQKQAGTFNGAMALIKTNVSLAAATAFKPLFDTISGLAVKFGEFVQTPTFNNWVSQIQQGMTAVIGLFREFASILSPIGDALAKFFGLNTGNISAQMDAVSKATVDVGNYNASLQGGGEAAGSNKAELQGLTEAVHAADAAILGFNRELADNQVLLDANARAIASVKNQYDPIIKGAEQSIREINTPSADELARKRQELELDRDKANLELTKPDTSVFDARILSDRTTLDNMPALDTSGYDTAITGYQAQIEALQGSISGLNTDELDEKINAIRDKLAEPAPDTHGINNQLVALNAQLGAGTIDKATFDTQYGALSRQKASIVDKYTDDTAGLSGQLKVLTQERNDQALANKETAQADRQRIRDLQDQVKIQEKGRSDAEKADAKARKDLEDDIKREGNLRAQALAPYTAAMKTITDAQAVNASKDAAAAAQRALDLAPYQAALDKAKSTEADLLAPLLAQKQTYDDNKTSLTEARQQQELAKQAAEGQATALKDAAANAKLLGQNLATGLPTGAGSAAKPGPNELQGAFGAGVGSQLDPSPFVSFVNTVTAKLRDLTASDDWNVIFSGKHLDGTPVGVKGRFDLAVTDIFDGIDKIDSGLQSWIKAHDADGIWGVLIYGKNPDGSTATAKQQLGVIFGGINNFITTWLGDNGPKWLTSWTEIGKGLGKAWDGPQNFNWGSVGATLGAINQGIDGWLSQHGPGWLTNWNTLGGDLGKAWDGPEGFNWTSVGHFFGGIATGIDTFATDHFPGWLTSWQGLVTGLGDAFSGLGDVIAGYLSGPTHEIGKFFNALGSGVHWLAQHFPGVKDVPDFVDNSGGGSNPVLGPPLPGHAGGLNFPGSPGPMPGHWAVAGENGPEPIYVPANASIIPNHVATALGMLPGHADGLNFDFLGDALGAVKSFVAGSAEKAVGAIMGKIGTPDLGIFPGLGGALAGMGKDALLGFLKPQEQAQSLGRTSANFGSGFKEMALAAYLAYLGNFGGPLDNESAFNDLMSVGQERNIDPRWFMAIMQTEDGFGTAAGDRLPQYNNYGGMGVRTGGLGFPSPVFATDGGPQPYAAFNSFRDFLEDEASWIAENGTSFLGYQTQDAGQGKNAAYQAILAAIPAIGGGAAGALGSLGFMQPVNGPITQPWGQTGSYLEPGGFHDGIDFGVPIGTPIMADASGVVDASGESGIGYGNWVRIQTDAFETWTGHMDSVLASVGDMVQKGQLVGYSGNTGASSGPHVHWGAHENGQSIDPFTLPGLAEGGSFSIPTNVTVGDGHEREFVLPESDLRAIVRSESGGGGGVTVANLNVYGVPGMDARDVADLIPAALDDYLSGARRPHGHAG